jgi:uncharacterized membrane protein
VEVLALLVGLYLLVAPAVGIAAYLALRKSRGEVLQLRARLTAATDGLDELTAAHTALRAELGLAPAPGPAPEAETPAAEPSEAAAPEAPEYAEPSEAERSQAAAREAFERSLRGEAPEAPPPEAPPPEAPPPETAPPETGPSRTQGGLEESLTSRWLVWLGAVTIALGSIFLVMYSIERGWLGPAVRVALGFAFGVVLLLAGEWLRQRPLQRAIAAVRPNYVPPAITSAGLFSAFASVYAAFQLYHLIGPVTAFLALAALAALGIALSILQGGMVAVLGLLGGFVTPWLVPAEQPSAWGLFAYLLFIVVAALAVVRYMAWWWLGWAALAGAALWTLLWVAGLWAPSDADPIGIFLILLYGLFLLVRHGRGATIELATWRKGLLGLPAPEVLAWGAALVVAGLVFVLIRMDAYGATSWLVLAAFAVSTMIVGYREAVFDALVLIAALLAVAVMAVWHLPAIIDAGAPLYTIGGRPFGRAPGPIVPPALVPFVAVSLVAAALFGLGGFVALWRVRRPGLWALASAATPLALIAVAYWRVTAFAVDLKWAAAALALAGAGLAAAAVVRRRDRGGRLDLVLGTYAAATVAATSFAATMALEQAWLTVALALQLPALAWIHGRLGVPQLRPVAALIAGVVLVRLVFNVHIVDYPVGDLAGANWVLYGYGLPALAFFFAARGFRRRGDDLLVTVLEGGCLAFATLLVSFEIRTLVEGRLDSPDYGLLEQSLNSVAWLSMAYLVWIYAQRDPRSVRVFGWRILAGLGAAQVVLLQLLVTNPLWSGAAVGAFPVVNLLFIAYAVPALFAHRFAAILRAEGHLRLARAGGILCLVLIWTYLSLEVRHAFQGPVLTLGPLGDAELYVYSAVWLGLALALLGIGILREVASLRYASLALLMVTVAKVFLVDMSELTGLYRVASFMGLGLILVGIGYLYQRFVFPTSSKRTVSAP